MLEIYYCYLLQLLLFTQLYVLVSPQATRMSNSPAPKSSSLSLSLWLYTYDFCGCRSLTTSAHRVSKSQESQVSLTRSALAHNNISLGHFQHSVSVAIFFPYEPSHPTPPCLTDSGGRVANVAEYFTGKRILQRKQSKVKYHPGGTFQRLPFAKKVISLCFPFLFLKPCFVLGQTVKGTYRQCLCLSAAGCSG